MNTWIFQGNPTMFNVDDYLLENEKIWWSIRQEHLAPLIELGDKVFIWRSNGTIRDSGGIVARTEVISKPQYYTNDEESAQYWYEDVGGDEYLAVELKVLELEVENNLKRTELLKDDILKELPILKLKQNTNYLLKDDIALSLNVAWKQLISMNIFEQSLDWELELGLLEDDKGFIEGKRILKKHLVRERKPKIIKIAKKRFKEKHGRLYCEVCDFDFLEKYGELGEDFIEGHHTIPVSELEEGQTTKVEDIALVCSNCHKMLHRRRPWLTIRQLSELIK